MMSLKWTYLLMLAAGCSTTTLGDAAAARAAAEALTGGVASGGESAVEDNMDVWEVDVAMPNGATLEVVLRADTGDLYEIFDAAGPFDYDTLDPLPGQLSYADARAVAVGEVDGTQEAWEVKWTADGYFYEFYLREVGDQLWEVKLWADDGEVFVVEAKDAID
jgi:uncharacterized membrane protein YkoI